jgi:hypothetical protein
LHLVTRCHLDDGSALNQAKLMREYFDFHDRASVEMAVESRFPGPAALDLKVRGDNSGRHSFAKVNST